MSTPVAALAAAEAADGYLAAVAASPLNAISRRDSRYVPSWLSPADASRLATELEAIPLLADARVVVLDASADGGYPHTRATNLVCMPTSAIKGKSRAELAETLRHESIHIHQRQYPDFWAAISRQEGWAVVPPGQIPLSLRDRCRVNPDTFRPSPFWAWEGWAVPLPLFYRDDSPRIGDVVIKWLDLRDGSLSSSPPPSFSARYGSSPPQPEHPYELLAVEAAAAGVTTDAALRSKLRKR